MSESAAILNTARAHFDKMRGQKIEVPEWGLTGENAACFDPPTLHRRQVIQTRAGKSTARQFALTVILCLRDKDGAPIFPDDAVSLAALESDVDPAVVSRIYTRIVGVTPEGDLGN